MKKHKPRHLEIERQELEAILERARSAPLSTEDYTTLKSAVDTLSWLTQELEAKGTSIERLRRMLFGPSTEKTSRILPEESASSDQPTSPGAQDPDGDEPRQKRQGHGRNGAESFKGAEKVQVSHESLAHGDPCPACERGKVYRQTDPARLLARREQDLSPPIQMCDALAHNSSEEFKTILANCMTHARRRFVDVRGSFPGECRYILEQLGEVYHHDHLARQHGLSPEERLAYHQEHSGPIMAGIQTWLAEQIDGHLVEPNSALGEAIKYMQNHWEKLTRFLHVAGAPLDNTICERALKRAILHRKNALFYKTELGAWVGDLFMSFIHTAELSGVDAFDYLVTLLRQARRVAQAPADWMPWNYRDALGRDGAVKSPPPAGS